MFGIMNLIENKPIFLCSLSFLYSLLLVTGHQPSKINWLISYKSGGMCEFQKACKLTVSFPNQKKLYEIFPGDINSYIFQSSIWGLSQLASTFFKQCIVLNLIGYLNYLKLYALVLKVGKCERASERISCSWIVTEMTYSSGDFCYTATSSIYPM